jgi:hypothetical protein
VSAFHEGSPPWFNLTGQITYHGLECHFLMYPLLYLKKYGMVTGGGDEIKLHTFSSLEKDRHD